MRSGVPAGCRPVRSRTSPSGPSTTAGFGSRASTGWTITCARCRPRRGSVAARNSMATSHWRDRDTVQHERKESETSMSATDEVIASTPGREVHLSRIYDAPRELVFKMWTDPKHLAQWWGPDGFTTTTHEIDVRPAGVWRFIMPAPDGRGYSNSIVYIWVAPPERLAYPPSRVAATEPV